MDASKYRPFPAVDLPDRTWPSKIITQAPLWCSVDLRDGNQALIDPMDIERKLKLFHLLVKLGFKEIEVGFPSASETEYAFLRTLIEDGHIPSDVTVQVLTQAREHLIRKTFESLKGCPQAIVHLYNSTSTLQREVVFRADKPTIQAIARDGAQLVYDLSQEYAHTQFQFEYSPESFTGTEVDFALEVCEAVKAVLKPTQDHPLILNLPATVEMSTPNVYADQVEYFCRHISDRNTVLVSLHNHNDRGCAVAAVELGLMAGGDRVEGTLVGNGERTGNVDIITLALNLLTQGVDPKLDFSNLQEVVDTVEYCNRLPIHPRHPYSGELVFTAFSGSHQDAINKGMTRHTQENRSHWEIPYLPIDPADIGRSYEAVIRINSQSGKGGVAYILHQHFGYQVPKAMQPEVSRVIQSLSEKTGKELSKAIIWETFHSEFIDRQAPFQLGELNYTKAAVTNDATQHQVTCEAQITHEDGVVTIKGGGERPHRCSHPSAQRTL